MTGLNALNAWWPWSRSRPAWTRRPSTRRSPPALSLAEAPAPDLSPVPVPADPADLAAALGQLDPISLALANVEPLADLDQLALQVALITRLVGQLVGRVEALEQPWRARRGRHRNPR